MLKCLRFSDICCPLKKNKGEGGGGSIIKKKSKTFNQGANPKRSMLLKKKLIRSPKHIQRFFILFRF